MSIPPSINALIERLNQELAQIEQEATEGLNLVRQLLNQFPKNIGLIQIFSSFGNAIVFVEIERRKILSFLENISTVDRITSDEIQEVGEDLASELGRVLDTKMMVVNLKNRLEN